MKKSADMSQKRASTTEATYDELKSRSRKLKEVEDILNEAYEADDSGNLIHEFKNFGLDR